MKFYLGVMYSGMHDSSVALVDECGRVRLAISEERLSGYKKDGRWPSRALEVAKGIIQKEHATCLGVCVPFSDPRILRREKEENLFGKMNSFLKREKKQKVGFGVYPTTWFDRIQSVFPGTPIYYAGHHRSHAALAYYQSGFDEACILTSDGGCYHEPWHMTMWKGNRFGLKLVAAMSSNEFVPLARFYSNVTALLGFRGNEDEGKITGLSAYGRVTQKSMKALCDLSHDPELGLLNFWVNTLSDAYLPAYLTNSFIERRLYEKYLSNLRREDIAAALQFLTEQNIERVINQAFLQKDRHLPIALAGGLFANVKLNGFIKKKWKSDIFIAPPMGDEGLSIGAVLANIAGSDSLRSSFVDTVYRGPSIESKKCLQLLKDVGIAYSSFSSNLEAIEEMAMLLKKGNVIAVCRGPMEYGPRALGNRSILAPANDRKIVVNLNVRLARSDFMPFAPVLCREDGERCFKDTGGAERATTFMTIALQATDWFQRKCPAVVHVDGTARPQIVDRDANLFLHELIGSYRDRTGLPALVNTSFNLHGEPIVCNENDALRTFFVAGLDYLFLDKYLISFKKNKKQAKVFLELQKARSDQRDKKKEIGLVAGLYEKIYESIKYPYYE